MELWKKLGDNPAVDHTIPPLSRTTFALAIWTGVILAAGLLPLRNFVGHPHWDNIQWVISTRNWTELRFYFDVLANLVLFVPLGVLAARQFETSGARSRLYVMGLGLLLSVGIETFQIFCHNRHPSLYDVLCNVGGTAFGLLAAARVTAFSAINRLLPRPHSHPTGSYPRS